MSLIDEEDLPASITSKIAVINDIPAQLAPAKELIQTLLQQSSDLEALFSQLTPLESGKLDVSISFTLASLCYILMNIHGIDTQNHPIHDHLQRIKAFVAKVKQIENPTAVKANEEQPKKKVKLDVGVAQRMIQHHI